MFFPAGLRGFAYSHEGVRPVPELAWHRLFVARTYRLKPGVVDGEDPELLKSGVAVSLPVPMLGLGCDGCKLTGGLYAVNTGG